MSAARLESPTRFSCLFLMGTMFVLTSSAARAQDSPSLKAEQTLVQVNFVTEMLGAPESFEIAGQIIRDYRPKIIGLFPSTGLVIDDKGHVLTFLGYRWVYINARNPRVEIIDSQEGKYPAELVGIDQGVGVAVVHAQSGRLKRTPVCESCELKGDTTVTVPILDGPKVSQFENAQILSVSTGGGTPGGGSEWAIRISRPLDVLGAPIFNAQHQVIGLISDQQPAVIPPVPRLNVTVLLASQMLNSANKIIKAGGDIQTGWLGVYPASQAGSGNGIIIAEVAKDSPAFRAGLLPGDTMVKWNGVEIRDRLKLVQEVQNTRIGSKAIIELRREGRPVIVTAVVEARKPEEPSEKLELDLPGLMSLPGAQITTGDVQLQAWLGIDVAPLTRQLAHSFRLPVVNGLLILNVNKQTAFDLAGVLAGDIIVDVDGLRISDPQAFCDHVRSRGVGSRLALRILHGGVALSKTIQVPKLPGSSRKHKN
jgi:S1-C subfamily serine protease